VEKINIAETLKNVESLMKSEKGSSPQMRAMMELLVVIITLLAAKLGLNSKNSSTPPSKDPNRAKKKSNSNGRKPGGQNGHAGSTLEKVPNPDRIEIINVDRSVLPLGDYSLVGYETRQVINIEISKVVTEYRAEILQDIKGRKFVARFPEDITRPVQYGDSVKAQSVYMSVQQLLPYERVGEYFENQCGISVSAGSLVNFNKEAYNLLEPFELLAKSSLQVEPILHSDETGINVNGKNIWLHTASSDKWTLFLPHGKRGGEAMIAMGILENFKGILCHDHWKPYFQFKCLHALCNAHHIRELERAWEHDKQQWAKNMQNLLIEMSHAKDAASGTLAENAVAAFVTRYRQILEDADDECPAPEKKTDGKRGRQARSKSRNLLERLRNFETEMLRFLHNPIVPFTNNQGERDIRMTKVQQKISGCFRAMEGAKIFCRIRSYLSTCNKQGVGPTEALRRLFAGDLPDFICSPL
jgi:transposase